MVSVLIGLSFIISFLLTLITIPFWIKRAKESGLVWEDMNKYHFPKNIAGSGGIVVVMSFVIGVLYYIAIRTFIFGDVNSISLEIFALLGVVLILCMMGVVDDLLGWKNKGLSRRTRSLLVFAATVPLMVINAGNSNVNLPFLGIVEFGLLYPLVLIPLGIAGASMTYNSLAGYNGLEAGQGIIILAFLSGVAYFTGTSWLAVIGLIMVTSLLGFLIYNKYPAKVFPGDSLTWTIGALIACMAILGDFEKIAFFIFMPYIIQAILKIRGKLDKQSFGKPQEDGSLEMPYKKIYGLEHFAIYCLKKMGRNKKVYEKDVVYFIHALQLFFIVLTVDLLFFKLI